MTTSRSHGLPRVCGSSRARVFGPRAASRSRGFTLYVPTSQSTKTGTSPPWTRGASVVGNVTAGVMTSSPGRSGRSRSGDISAMTAARFAVERARRPLAELARGHGQDQTRVEGHRAGQLTTELGAREAVLADDVHDARDAQLDEPQARLGEELGERRVAELIVRCPHGLAGADALPHLHGEVARGAVPAVHRGRADDQVARRERLHGLLRLELGAPVH